MIPTAMESLSLVIQGDLRSFPGESRKRLEAYTWHMPKKQVPSLGVRRAVILHKGRSKRSPVTIGTGQGILLQREFWKGTSLRGYTKTLSITIVAC